MNDLQMGQLIESVKQLVKNQDKHEKTHEKINSVLETLVAEMTTAKAHSKNLKIYISIFIIVVNGLIAIIGGIL